MNILNVYPCLILLGLFVLFSLGGSVPRAGGQAHTSSDARYEIENFSNMPLQSDVQDLHLADLFRSLKEVGLVPKLGASQINGISAPMIVTSMSDDMTQFSENFDNTSPMLVLPIPNQHLKAAFLVMRSNPHVMYVAYAIPVATGQQLLMITPASQIADISSASKSQPQLAYEGHLSDEPLFRRVAVSGQSIFMFDDYKVHSMSGESPGYRAEVESEISNILVRRGFELLRKTIHSEHVNIGSQNESSVPESLNSSIWVKDNRVISIQVRDIDSKPALEHESVQQDLNEHYVGLEIYETYGHPLQL